MSSLFLPLFAEEGQSNIPFYHWHNHPITLIHGVGKIKDVKCYQIWSHTYRRATIATNMTRK